MSLAGAALAGALAGLGIAMPLGEVGAYLVSLTARAGPRVGVAAALGVASADGLYATLAVAGGSAVADLVEPVAEALRVAAAVVLAVLAASIAVRALRERRVADLVAEGKVERTASARRAYAGLLALTLANPATVVYFVALVVGNRVAGSASGAAAVAFAAGVLVASAAWQLLLVGGGHVLGSLATSRRGRLVVSLAASLLVLVLAAHTALS